MADAADASPLHAHLGHARRSPVEDRCGFMDRQTHTAERADEGIKRTR
jgi:hypothetical protein